MNIRQKLSIVQKNLVANKGQTNSFGKYSYRSCEDILEALKPHLDGCTVTLSDEMVMVGDRIYVKSTATFADESHAIDVTAFAREPESRKGMDDAQLTGATSSYARKYALMACLALMMSRMPTQWTTSNTKRSRPELGQ